MLETWIDEAKIEVKHSVVYITGTVDRCSEKDLVEKWAALTDGVVAVESRLTWRCDDREIQPVLPRR